MFFSIISDMLVVAFSFFIESNCDILFWASRLTSFSNSLEEKRKHYSNYQAEVNEILMKGSDEATAWIIANDKKFLAETKSNQVLLRKDYQKTMADAVAANALIGSSLIEKVSNNLKKCQDSAKGFENAAVQYGISTTASNDGVSKTVKKLSNDYYALTGKVKGLDKAEDNLKDAIGDVEGAVNELNSAQQAQYTLDYKRVQTMIDKYKELAREIQNAKEADKDKNMGKGTFQLGYEVGGQTNYSSETLNAWYVVSGVKIQDEKGFEYIQVSSLQNGQGDKAYMRLGDSEYDLNDDYIWKPGDAINGNYYLYQKRFATGGFADFTGPAWLDGTKKKPEAVLNALQTKHFIQFTNALDTIFNGHSNLTTPTQSNQKSGDANYTFHINIDQMASDYDVDKLIERIEEKMIKASRYRNVTMVKKQI
jgi:hypothetical protein